MESGAAKPVIDARGLYKSFGTVDAVPDLSFSVDAGQVLGITIPWL